MEKFIPDLAMNASSVRIVLSGSVAQAAIPDTAQKVGILTGSTTIKVSLNEIPENSGSVSGSATALNFAKGIPLSASPTFGINWFDIGFGKPDRVLYFRNSGSPGDSVTVIYI